jgi:4'-phosphopantetheinyl transferase
MESHREVAGRVRVDVPAAGEVLIARFAAEQERAQRAELGELLSADERRRADRYRFDGDRDRFVVARARLRLLLAALGAGAPARIQFAHGARGKLWLPAHPELQFNVSHAGGLVVVAVAWRVEVGVDVEPLERHRRQDEAAERFFSLAERSALARLHEPERAAAVLRCWCRKEAYLKARGEGLARRLDSFDVATDEPSDGAASLLLATRPDAAEAAAWHVRDLDVGAGYAAALALPGRMPRLRMLT